MISLHAWLKYATLGWVVFWTITLTVDPDTAPSMVVGIWGAAGFWAVIATVQVGAKLTARIMRAPCG